MISNTFSHRRGQSSGIIVGAVVAALFIGLILGYFFFSGGDVKHEGSSSDQAPSVWTCSMHPQIKQPKAGKCPICFMDLIPLAGNDMDEGPRQLVLSETARQLAEIRTATVTRGPATRTLRLVGTLAYDETLVRHTTAWVPGRIDRLFVNYTGVPVKAGDHMAEIYSPMLISAHQELLQAKGRPDLLEGARQRLLRWGILPQQLRDMEIATHTYQHLTIHASMGGVVVQKHVSEGMYVDQGKPLFTIADLSHLWLLISAYESDVRWLRFGQQVDFSVDALPGETFSGILSFIDPVLAEKSRTVPVRISLPNPKGNLKPGMFSHALIRIQVNGNGDPIVPNLHEKWVCPMHPEVIKDGPGVCDVCSMAIIPADSPQKKPEFDNPLLVPETAVLWTGKRSVVYRAVPAKPSAYDGVEVEIGPRTDGFYIVKSGLEEGDQVVVNGAFKLDSELQIKAKPSMMNRMDDSGVPSSAGAEALPSHAFPDAEQAHYKSIVTAILDIGKALAADNLAEAQSGSDRGKEALNAINDSDFSPEAKKVWQPILSSFGGGFEHLKSAKDIQNARGGLKHLTMALDKAFSTFGQPLSQPVARMFCPMAFNNQGAEWFQVEETLANPYFGEAMLRCGEKRSELPPNGSSPR